MAKKKPIPETSPSRPPIGPGGGGAARAGGVSSDMDSGGGKNSAIGESSAAYGHANQDSDFLTDWKSSKEKLRTARNAILELPSCEYENLIREMIQAAPTSWHVRQLILQAVERLQRLSNGLGDHRFGIPANDEGVIGRVNFQLAQVARKFNVSLTTKSTPEWLLKAKKHPEFQRGWKEFCSTRGEQERLDEARVIEIPRDAEQTGETKLRCVFEKKIVRMEWCSGEDVTKSEIRTRISSNGVLQFWLSDVLVSFDKSLEYPGSPMSHDWAERWADEKLYMKHFMPHAKREWNPAEVDDLQVHASGLLTTNNSSRNGKPRYDFRVFEARIKRLALRQIRVWRDRLVPPAKRVSQK